MQDGRIRVWLSPLTGGAYTRFRMTGVVPTAVAARDLKRLSEKLSFWSGYRVGCALSVEREGAGWCEWWTERLVAIPECHLEVRFIIRRRARGEKEVHR